VEETTAEESNSFFVTDQEAGIRLDKLLTAHFPQYSRSYFQYLIEKKLVLIDGEPIKKRFKPESGTEIEIEFSLPEEIELEAESIPLKILYEDDFFLAVNKPPGMVVHPGAGNWTGTFVNALLYHCKHLQASKNLRPGIVHRLDKDTTGMLLAAKTEESHQRLVELFASRQIKKKYLAICIGNAKKGWIDGPIGRHPLKRKSMAIVPTGKTAKTYLETIAYNKDFSFVHLYPETGRTHQLRVHLQANGTPILGDPLYGIPSINKKFEVNRQLLHAQSLEFLHPCTGKVMKLMAPIPSDMQKFIDVIEQSYRL
jgi:23S rRNA pseudouridine1911/1915/1917 synthase